jgi:choline dehydrogenase-like flavoprotein
MTDRAYDVVIVGGGIAGATVAKTIADTGGKRILILEAGRSTGMSADKYASHVEAFQASSVNAPNTPYPNTLNAPQADVLDIKQILGQPTPGKAPGNVVDDGGYLVQTGPLPFQSDYTRALGGTTLHWLGTCLRMLPNDFQLQSRYGQGVDWPITYDDLRPYYERAETDIIGVAGSVTDQHYPGIDDPTFFGAYDYPMHAIPASYLDSVLTDRLDGQPITIGGATYEVRMSNTPAGRNSMPRNGYAPVGAPGNEQLGQRCEGNTNCIPICPVQAKYSALKTLYELMQRHPGNLEPNEHRSSVTIMTQAVASAVEIDANGRVSGITYQTYDHENLAPKAAPQTAHGTIYVLAANAIQNATLLLSSGAANSSGMVGRNLMDHPLILTWGLMDEPVWGFRGPLSTSGLEMFRDGAFRDRNCAFRIEIGNEGWNFTSQAPNSTVQTLVQGTGGLFGRELRRTIGEVIPRQFRLGLEMEQIPEASNYVTIDPAYRDQLGNPRPVIRYNLPDYVRAGFAMAREASDGCLPCSACPSWQPSPSRTPSRTRVSTPPISPPMRATSPTATRATPSREPVTWPARTGWAVLIEHQSSTPGNAPGTTTTSTSPAAEICRPSARPTRP